MSLYNAEELRKVYDVANKHGLPCGSDEWWTWYCPHYLAKGMEAVKIINRIRLAWENREKYPDQLEFEVENSIHVMRLYNAAYHKHLKEWQEKKRREEEESMKKWEAEQANTINEPTHNNECI